MADDGGVRVRSGRDDKQGKFPEQRMLEFVGALRQLFASSVEMQCVRVRLRRSGTSIF